MFSSMRYISEAWSFSRDDNLKTQSEGEPRQSSVRFLQSRCPSIPRKSVRYKTPVVQLLRTISLKKGLLVHYGHRY